MAYRPWLNAASSDSHCTGDMCIALNSFVKNCLYFLYLSPSVFYKSFFVFCVIVDVILWGDRNRVLLVRHQRTCSHWVPHIPSHTHSPLAHARTPLPMWLTYVYSCSPAQVYLSDFLSHWQFAGYNTAVWLVARQSGWCLAWTSRGRW